MSVIEKYKLTVYNPKSLGGAVKVVIRGTIDGQMYQVQAIAPTTAEAILLAQAEWASKLPTPSEEGG